MKSRVGIAALVATRARAPRVALGLSHLKRYSIGGGLTLFAVLVFSCGNGDTVKQPDSQSRSTLNPSVKADALTSDADENPFSSAGALRSRVEDLERQLGLVSEKARRVRSTPTIWPVNGRIGSPYVSQPGDAEAHLGIDIVAAKGTPIKATADGVVLFAAREGQYGNLAVLKHPEGFSTRYGHLSRFSVKAQDTVKKGQIIGWVGMTGRTEVAQLHYEVRLNDRPVNPRRYLPPAAR